MEFNSPGTRESDKVTAIYLPYASVFPAGMPLSKGMGLAVSNAMLTKLFKTSSFTFPILSHNFPANEDWAEGHIFGANLDGSDSEQIKSTGNPFYPSYQLPISLLTVKTRYN